MQFIWKACESKRKSPRRKSKAKGSERETERGKKQKQKEEEERVLDRQVLRFSLRFCVETLREDFA